MMMKFWGAQAASLQFAAACRERFRKAFVSCTRYERHRALKRRRASCPARQASSLRSPAICIVSTGLALVALCSCQKVPLTNTRVDPNAPVEVLLPERGAYTGAFMDFGDAEDALTLDLIEDFETMVGKHQAIIASSSYWGEQSFPTANLNVIWRHGSLPLVFWSPWDRPYEQNKGPDRFSLSAIIAGTWDDYIDRWADGAKVFGKPMIVVFANEMNGDWFPLVRHLLRRR